VDFKLPDDFKPITPQHVFDAAWNAFVIGDAPPARSRAGGCSYLNDKGDKCAIGLLLPDGHPAQKASGNVYHLLRLWPELFDYRAPPRLWLDLQVDLHDCISSGHEHEASWTLTQAERREIYEQFARKHDLTIPSSEVQS
jgi:hypothetical protein